MSVARRLREAGVGDGLWTAAIAAGSKAQGLVVVAAAGTLGGIEIAGHVILTMAAGVVAMAAIDAGLTPQLSRLFAKGVAEDRRAALVPFAWRVALHPVIGAALFFVVTAPNVGGDQWGWWLAAQVAYGVSMHGSSAATAMAFGQFRFRGGSGLNAAVRLATIPALMGAAAARFPAPTLLLIIAAGEVAIAVGQYRLAQPRRHGGSPQPAAALRVAQTWRFGVGAVANTVMNRADTVVIATVLVAGALGTYAVASQAQNALTTIAMIPAGALIAHAARGGTATHLRRQLSTTRGVVLGVYLVVAAPFALAPEWLTATLLRVELADPLALRLCLLAGVFSVLGGVQMQSLTGRGEAASVARIWVTTAAMGILLMIALAAMLGAVGAALGAVLRDLMFFALSLSAVQRVSQGGSSS